MKQQNLTKKPLVIAMGVVMASMSLGAMAETINGVSAPYYDPGSFGKYYQAAGGYAGRAYQYAVGVNIGIGNAGNSYAPIITLANGFGEAGDLWSVRGDEHLMTDPMISGHIFGGVGQASWCQAGACAGSSGTSIGWNNTTQHVLFGVTTESDIKITVSNAPSVEFIDGPNEQWGVGSNLGALGNDLIPGFTLYDGYSDEGWGPISHTFNNAQDYTLQPLTSNKGSITVVPGGSVDMIYRDHNANVANANSISATYHLPVGLYSLWFGGNIANTSNTNEDLLCATQVNGNCMGFGGNGKNFQVTIETASTVPVPAAAWLFGGALSALGAVGRRRKITT